MSQHDPFNFDEFDSFDTADAIKRKRAVDDIPKPWNPRLLSLLTFLLTPLVSMTLLSLNWTRFNKRIGLATFFGWIGIGILGVVVTATLLFSYWGLELNVMTWDIIAFSAFVFTIIFTFCFPFLIAGRQLGAYNIMKRKNIYAAIMCMIGGVGLLSGRVLRAY